MLFFSIGDIMATRFLRINDDFRDSLEETILVCLKKAPTKNRRRFYLSSLN